ncbi:conserved protein, unknown function [Hepatocystis sp. ex Piliocolobus tephrosceles]|nr:conserved protein, unknown function [Hepatocystis sp. ex Piliocolobus tephrosceles]
MANKLLSLFVITIFFLVNFSYVITGHKNENSKNNMWISRFNMGKDGNKINKDADRHLHETYKKDTDNLLNSNKKDVFTDERSALLLKEIYTKDKELSIIKRKKKMYKNATITLGTLIAVIAIRLIKKYIENYLLKLVDDCPFLSVNKNMDKSNEEKL